MFKRPAFFEEHVPEQVRLERSLGDLFSMMNSCSRESLAGLSTAFYRRSLDFVVMPSPRPTVIFLSLKLEVQTKKTDFIQFPTEDINSSCSIVKGYTPQKNCRASEPRTVSSQQRVAANAKKKNQRILDTPSLDTPQETPAPLRFVKW